MNYWLERHQSLGAYVLMLVVYALIATGVLSAYHYLFPKKVQATSSTSVGNIASGGIATVTNINYKPEDTSQGLYASLGSDRVMVGVYKEINSHLEIQLGAGKTYDDSAIAEVTAKVKF